MSQPFFAGVIGRGQTAINDNAKSEDIPLFWIKQTNSEKMIRII
jgi:hypothetical protein